MRIQVAVSAVKPGHLARGHSCWHRPPTHRAAGMAVGDFCSFQIPCAEGDISSGGEVILALQHGAQIAASRYAVTGRRSRW